jgi:ABC-type molybdenum transport system ATPase subunit/photorepair protein PhrA
MQNVEKHDLLNYDFITEKAVHYVITGPAESGKSSLLCNWIKQLRSDSVNSDLCVIYHFVGAAEESTGKNSLYNLVSV